jgi:hypothetical protein
MAGTRWQIILDIEDGEIFGVTGPYGPGIPFVLDDRKKIRKSTYGLRPVDTIYDHDTKGEATIEAPRRCYMIIGGFKVEVPCT